jgi:hypothetical protein
MPQTNYLTLFQATYPLLAPVQKPPGVTVLTTATAPRVPNKFVYASGSIQSYDPDLGRMVLKSLLTGKIEEQVEERPRVERPHVEEPVHEAEAEPDDEPHGRGGRRRR